jgi:hypothetical protein
MTKSTDATRTGERWHVGWHPGSKNYPCRCTTGKHGFEYSVEYIADLLNATLPAGGVAEGAVGLLRECFETLPHYNDEMGDCYAGCEHSWDDNLHHRHRRGDRCINIGQDGEAEWHDADCAIVSWWRYLNALPASPATETLEAAIALLEATVPQPEYAKLRRRTAEGETRCLEFSPRDYQCQWVQGHLGPHNHRYGGQGKVDELWGGEPCEVRSPAIEAVLPALRALVKEETT